MNSIMPSPIPSRATAEPPSGTPVAEFAEKLKKSWLPPAFWTVKAHVATVSSNPSALMMPVPVMFRNVAVWSYNRCAHEIEREPLPLMQ